MAELLGREYVVNMAELLSFKSMIAGGPLAWPQITQRMRREGHRGKLSRKHGVGKWFLR